jgi:hypothetical protein
VKEYLNTSVERERSLHMETWRINGNMENKTMEQKTWRKLLL